MRNYRKALKLEQRMKRKTVVLVLLCVVVFIAGCKAPDEAKIYDKPLPPGEYALRKLTNADDIPEFLIACYELDNLRTAVAGSLNYLKKPSSREFFPCGEITHDRTVVSLEAFAELLDSGLMGRELNRAIRERFDVYTTVGCDYKGTVLFTGYYTPIFEGSLEPTARFRYPLYSQPEDLVKGRNGEILGRRLDDGRIVAYPSRSEIERSGMLTGNEMVWLSDPFEVYVAHVQGSAKVRTLDGQLVTVGYAANNGHEYNSVAEELIGDGKIASEDMSLTAMMDYFKRHTTEISLYIQRNPRYVFFQTNDGEPRGSLNEQVIPMRTIATDKSIYPRASLAFLSTTLPRVTSGRVVKRAFTGFALDQDTGGAIRAPGRCDVYMGQGDLAGRMAGQVREEGRLYYLFVKSTPAISY